MYCRTPPRPRRCSCGPRRSTTTASTRRDTASASPSPRSRTPVLDAESPSNGGEARFCAPQSTSPRATRAADRGDIEVLFEGLPEPIDLDLDTRMLCWTDRGDPPLGNTVNRAPMDPEAGQRKSEILLTHLQEGTVRRAVHHLPDTFRPVGTAVGSSSCRPKERIVNPRRVCNQPRERR
jgi:hypothetical protein